MDAPAWLPRERKAHPWAQAVRVSDRAPQQQQQAGPSANASQQEATLASRCCRTSGAWIGAGLRATFLPVGYPGSVSPDYLEYQLFDTIQALCSYLRGILATRAVLEGLGVGDATKTVLASTLTWVLKDGVSLLTGLCFSTFAARFIDAHPKFFRLVADVSNDIALTVELCAPIIAAHAAQSTLLFAASDDEDVLAGRESLAFLWLVSLANSLKAICGVAAGSVRMVLTQHFAKDRNGADVNAKEASQETAVTLLGIVAGSAALAPFDSSPHLAFYAFFVLTVVHVWANWRAVSALRLVTLNENRVVCALGVSLHDGDLVALANANDPIWPRARTDSSLAWSLIAASMEAAWTTVSSLGVVLWSALALALALARVLLLAAVPGVGCFVDGFVDAARLTEPSVVVEADSIGSPHSTEAAPMAAKVTAGWTSSRRASRRGMPVMHRALSGAYGEEALHIRLGCHPGDVPDSCIESAASDLTRFGVAVARLSQGLCVVVTSKRQGRQEALLAGLIECFLDQGVEQSVESASLLLEQWRKSAVVSGFNPDAVAVTLRDEGWVCCLPEHE